MSVSFHTISAVTLLPLAIASLLVTAGCSADSSADSSADGDPKAAAENDSDDAESMSAEITDDRLIDPSQGYSIVLLEGWTEEDGMLLSPLSDDEDPFRENAHVVVVTSESTQLSAFAPILRQSMSRRLQNFAELSDSEMQIGGHNGLVLTFTYSDPQAKLDGKCMAFVVHDRGKTGAVIFTALSETFDEWMDDFMRMGTTFRIE